MSTHNTNHSPSTYSPFVARVKALGAWAKRVCNNAFAGVVIGVVGTLLATSSSNEVAKDAIASQERISEMQRGEDRDQKLRDERRVAYGDLIVSSQALVEVTDQRAAANCARGLNTKALRPSIPCVGPSIERVDTTLNEWRESVRRAKIVASPDATTSIRAVERIVVASAAIDMKEEPDFTQQRLEGLLDIKDKEGKTESRGALSTFESLYGCETMPEGLCRGY